MMIADYAPSRMAGAIRANQKLIETKLQQYPQDMVGIISFAGRARLGHPIITVSDGVESLLKSLNNVFEFGGGTNFLAPLELAESHLCIDIDESKPKSMMDELLAATSMEPIMGIPAHIRQPDLNDKNLSKHIILLTDGVHNCVGSP